MTCAARLSAILVAVLVAMALAGCASVTPTATNARDWLIQYRTGNGLTPIRLDPRLAAFAQAQADIMASRDVLSHDVGGSFAARVEAAGLGNGKIAENVLYGATTEAGAMRQWQASPAHDRNLLMPGATRFGIASARSGGARPRTYWAMAIAADPPPPIPSMVDAGPLIARPVAVRRTDGPLSGLTAPFAGLFGN